MKTKLIVFIISYFLSLITFCTTASASQTLTVSPQTIRILSQPGTTVSTPLTVENPLDQIASINYSFKRFTQDENGAVVFLSDFYKNSPLPFDAHLEENNNKLDDSFKLEPKEKKNIILKIQIKPDQKASDYYFSAVFISSAANDISQNSSHIAIGVASNVLLSIGEGAAQGSVSQFSAPIMLEHGPVPFTVSLSNNGSHLITPSGHILITNMFGQVVGKVDLSSKYILSGSSRLIPEESKRTNGDPTQAYWNDKVTFGLYKADLYVTYFPNGEIDHKTIRFFSLPIKTTAVIIALIVFFSFVFHRAKKYTR